MTVTYNGRDFPPPTPDAPWSRARFGDLLDAISDHRTHTVRVEVHEFDGSVFTDIVHAVRREQPIADVQSLSTMRRARHRPPDQLIEVTGSGFVPGEDVTVALVRSTAEATASGTVRVTLNLGELPTGGADVLLVGTSSARVVTRRVP